MSGDHNMNQTDSGWRKRQIAFDKKAENARELGLDYEPSKTVIEMAREAGICTWLKPPADVVERIEAFAALVREEATAEANARANASWTLMCEKMVAIEREACAKVCFDFEGTDPLGVSIDCAAAIRNRENT
jgi:hypothetical protein